jgi:hypothetical protein
MPRVVRMELCDPAKALISEPSSPSVFRWDDVVLTTADYKTSPLSPLSVQGHARVLMVGLDFLARVPAELRQQLWARSHLMAGDMS